MIHDHENQIFSVEKIVLSITDTWGIFVAQIRIFFFVRQCYIYVIYIYRESKGFMQCIREIKFLSIGKIKFSLVYE